MTDVTHALTRQMLVMLTIAIESAECTMASKDQIEAWCRSTFPDVIALPLWRFMLQLSLSDVDEDDPLPPSDLEVHLRFNILGQSIMGLASLPVDYHDILRGYNDLLALKYPLVRHTCERALDCVSLVRTNQIRPSFTW